MSNYSLRKRATDPKSVPPISQDTTNNDNINTDTNTASATTPTSTATAPRNIEEYQEARDASSEDSDDESLPEIKFWDGKVPQANGTLSKLFTHPDTRASDEEHEALVTFLYSNTEENKADKIQFDDKLYTFITAIPGSTRKIRLIYGLGSGIGLTGITKNKLEKTILALTGEYEEGIAYPTVLKFPETALSPTKLNTPSFDEFHTQLETGNTNATWFKYGDLSVNSKIPMLVPVPARFICDGFDDDLDAADVFERLTAVSKQTEKDLKATLHLLRTFLTAVVVKYNQKDPTILPPQHTFMLHPSPLLNKWKKQKMTNLFPSLLQTTPEKATAPTKDNGTVATTPSIESSDSQNTTKDWSPDSFLKAFMAMQTSTTKAPDTTKEVSTVETLGMGTFSYNLLLNLSGLAPGTADEILPLWSQLAEKNLNKSDKLTFVRRSIEDNVKWSESKVLPLNTLLTMVVTRAWEGETTLSSLTSAAKGLTPFAVPCLTESEVTSQNDLADALDAASNTTVKDHSASKLTASAPTSFDGLVKRIKRFGNLLFAIFGENSALFMQIEDMITALDAYGEYARTTMSHQTIASILWITHLQARHYSAGAMTGTQALKAEFTTMMNAIVTKAPVIHMDTPPNLYQQPPTHPNPRKRDTPTPAPSNPTPYESPNKTHKPNDGSDRFQLVDRNVMNAKMKIAMKPITSLPRVPNMGKICRAARTTAGELFPSHKDICIRSQILGKCFVSCAHKHMKLSDEEIKPALKMLESVLANPALIKVN